MRKLPQEPKIGRPPKPPQAKQRASIKAPPPVRNLTFRAPEHGAEWEALITAFESAGPPLVTAMLGQAIVEHRLDALLKYKLAMKEERWDEITKDRGPLGSFYLKIMMAHGLSLIDDAIRDHLNRIRNIRNAFAHAKVIFDFDEPSIAHELRNAKLPTTRPRLRFDTFRYIKSASTRPRTAYMTLCMATYHVLISREIRGLKAQSRNYSRHLRRLIKDQQASGALDSNTQ